MANFLSQKELVNQISERLEKLEQGTLTVQELENHVEQARELYERALIIRHKAYETTVGIEPKTEVETVEHIVETPEEEELNNTQDSEIEQEETNVAFDFSADDTEEDEAPSLEFGLFSSTETISEQENEQLVEATEDVAESEIDLVDLHHDSPAPQEVLHESTNSDFTGRFTQIHQATANQIGYEKLDTLIGSFGLNERLQYINELFNGSSEDFSDSVKALDNLSNIQTAKEVSAKLALKYDWDQDSDTVEEFIQKLCRRYAS